MEWIPSPDDFIVSKINTSYLRAGSVYLVDSVFTRLWLSNFDNRFLTSGIYITLINTLTVEHVWTYRDNDGQPVTLEVPFSHDYFYPIQEVSAECLT